MGQSVGGLSSFYFVQPLQDLLDLRGPVADIRCIQNVTGLIRMLSEGAQELFDFQLDRHEQSQ
jgi:hypothetical protein